jgi:protoporphyrinogen oxidase
MTSPNPKQAIVLGAGISGISAAYHLQKLGGQAVVYEAASRPGGLLDHFTIDGFRFDNAIHLSFATEPEVREVFDRTAYFAHPATSWCWDDDIWLKHPVQNNMAALDAQKKVELIAGLVERPDIKVRHYKDWLLYQYGEPIANRWQLPYTEKYWTVGAEELGLKWIGNRVRRADIREVLHGAFTTETPSYYYAAEMRYPKQGGYRSFIEPMLAEVDVRCGFEVKGVRVADRRVYFANGETASWESLISTMPLPRLIELMDDVPEPVRVAAASLFATSLDLISVGFRRADIQPHLWFYIYDKDILAARAYSPSIKSPDNVPTGCSSLQFEIYSSPRKPQTATPEQMKENTKAALKTMGVLQDEEDIVFMHHKRLPWGNVVFDLGMEERRAIVTDWVEQTGIVLAGRFGQWEYQWSNQAFMSGMGAAQRIDAR